MEAIAFPTQFEAVFRTTGHIVDCSEDGFSVATEKGTFLALRATSCLLEPQAEDKVLLVGDPSGGLYVLAILEREAGLAGRIKSDGDLVMDVGEGTFSVSAGEGIKMNTPEALELSAGRIEARAGRARFMVGAVKVVGKTVDSVLDRVSQRVKNSVRWVESLDQVRSGQVDYQAEGMMRLHGENTMMTASKLVKADGKQVHIG